MFPGDSNVTSHGNTTFEMNLFFFATACREAGIIKTRMCTFLGRLVFRVFVLSLQGLACSAFSCLHQGFLKRSNAPPNLQSQVQPAYKFLGVQHQFAFGAVSDNLKDVKSFKRGHQVGLFAKASNGDESEGFWDIGDITEKLDKTVRQQKPMVRAYLCCSLIVLHP
jgi:hypothetical protein